MPQQETGREETQPGWGVREAFQEEGGWGRALKGEGTLAWVRVEGRRQEGLQAEGTVHAEAGGRDLSGQLSRVSSGGGRTRQRLEGREVLLNLGAELSDAGELSWAWFALGTGSSLPPWAGWVGRAYLHSTPRPCPSHGTAPRTVPGTPSPGSPHPDPVGRRRSKTWHLGWFGES